jgi:hypothetical protein
VRIWTNFSLIAMAFLYFTPINSMAEGSASDRTFQNFVKNLKNGNV